MSEPVSDRTWRNRYVLMTGLQLGGVVIALTGMLIGRRGLFQLEAMPVVGIVLAFAGLIIAFFAPRRLAHYWKTRPTAERERADP